MERAKVIIGLKNIIDSVVDSGVGSLEQRETVDGRMSRARKEEKKEQRKESEDLMTEVEVWRKARERRKIHGEA